MTRCLISDIAKKEKKKENKKENNDNW